VTTAVYAAHQVNVAVVIPKDGHDTATGTVSDRHGRKAIKLHVCAGSYKQRHHRHPEAFPLSNDRLGTRPYEWHHHLAFCTVGSHAIGTRPYQWHHHLAFCTVGSHAIGNKFARTSGITIWLFVQLGLIAIGTRPYLLSGITIWHFVQTTTTTGSPVTLQYALDALGTVHRVILAICTPLLIMEMAVWL
jgi:hypothetical protein